jgi:hypothetical protein
MVFVHSGKNVCNLNGGHRREMILPASVSKRKSVVSSKSLGLLGGVGVDT